MVFRFFIEGRVEGVGGGFCNPQLLNQGRIQGGEHGALPPKIGKDIIFLRKMVIFHTKYPKIFAPPSARRNFLKCAPPPNLKFWIRPCIPLTSWGNEMKFTEKIEKELFYSNNQNL